MQTKFNVRKKNSAHFEWQKNGTVKIKKVFKRWKLRFHQVKGFSAEKYRNIQIVQNNTKTQIERMSFILIVLSMK